MIDIYSNSAGDLRFISLQNDLRPLILTGELRIDILNFDLDAFITAVIRYLYKEPVFFGTSIESLVIRALHVWMNILATAVRFTFNHNLQLFFLLYRVSESKITTKL